MPRNLTASARTYPQTLLRLPDMLVIECIAKENKFLVILVNDKTRIRSSRLSCDEQKRSNQERHFINGSLYIFIT